MSWRRYIMTAVTEIDLGAISANLRSVSDRIGAAYEDASPEFRAYGPARLVAVTKTMPVQVIVAAYEFGQRHFGENYAEELITKAGDSVIINKCPDIRWHFIGHLQTKKIPKLIENVPNLFLVETVDSEKCARKLNDAFSAKKLKNSEEFLRVMIQVNTSGEAQKNGLTPAASVDLAEFIEKNCPHLKFAGFMTIGSVEETKNTAGMNMDFVRLIDTRREYAQRKLIENVNGIELSMGMSADFETAVKMGATNVRVGSTIFGPRMAKK